MKFRGHAHDVGSAGQRQGGHGSPRDPPLENDVGARVSPSPQRAVSRPIAPPALLSRWQRLWRSGAVIGCRRSGGGRVAARTAAGTARARSRAAGRLAARSRRWQQVVAQQLVSQPQHRPRQHRRWPNADAESAITSHTASNTASDNTIRRMILPPRTWLGAWNVLTFSEPTWPAIIIRTDRPNRTVQDFF